MTEDEAKTKWCPHARVGDRDCAPNRDCDGTILSVHKCIASQCMAWRAVPVKSTNIDGVTIHENGGYCGLAGAPA